MICRREFLTSIPIGLALAGCAQLQSGVAALPQFAQDASLIASSLGTIVDTLGGVTGVSSDLIAKVKSGVAVVQQLAGQITASAASGVSSVTGLVGGFGSSVSGLLSSLGGISIPSWASTGLQAVSALLPLVMSAAGLVLAAPRASASSMTPEAARAYLSQMQSR